MSNRDEPKADIENELDEALARLEERNQFIEELANVGSWEIDVRTGERAWSPNLFRLFGVETANAPLARAAVIERIHPDDRRLVSDIPAQLAAATGPGCVEVRSNPELGPQRHFRATWKCVRDDDGNPTKFVGIFADITDSVTASEELRASEAKYRALFDQSVEGIYLHDLQGNLLDVNAMACRQAGRSRGELLQMTVFDLLEDPSEKDRILQQWSEWQVDQRFSVEAAHRNSEGVAFPVEISTGKIRYQGRDAMLAIVRDVTDRKRADQERERLQAQLRQAQKMESIGRLAGGVAHDFNNVLCAVTGNAGLAMRSLSAGDSLRGSMEEILKAAKRATNLTRQLLAFSRRQVLEPKVLDLNELVEHLESMLARLIGEDIILRTSMQAALGRVQVDPGQIEQIVLNLAINARDAMPLGGTLLIETANVELDESYCSKQADVRPGAYVMLAVSDTGSGMNAETRDQIFEPFFTTKRLGQGTGLGLATVFGIVAQHGGSIQVLSELGQGTCFKIYFPRVQGKAETLRSSEMPEVRGGSETLLVVEDEEIVRTASRRVLESLGYSVLAVGSGAEAIALVRGYSGPIDLLLTDVIMPHMDGHALAQALVEIRPGLKVLYTSGYTPDIIAHRGVLDEGVLFLAKPYSLDTLAARVREVLDSAGAK